MEFGYLLQGWCMAPMSAMHAPSVVLVYYIERNRQHTKKSAALPSRLTHDPRATHHPCSDHHLHHRRPIHPVDSRSTVNASQRTTTLHHVWLIHAQSMLHSHRPLQRMHDMAATQQSSAPRACSSTHASHHQLSLQASRAHHHRERIRTAPRPHAGWHHTQTPTGRPTRLQAPCFPLLVTTSFLTPPSPPSSPVSLPHSLPLPPPPSSPSSPPPATEQPSDDDNQCLLCFNAPATLRLMPCRHDVF